MEASQPPRGPPHWGYRRRHDARGQTHRFERGECQLAPREHLRPSDFEKGGLALQRVHHGLGEIALGDGVGAWVPGAGDGNDAPTGHLHQQGQGAVESRGAHDARLEPHLGDGGFGPAMRFDVAKARRIRPCHRDIGHALGAGGGGRLGQRTGPEVIDGFERGAARPQRREWRARAAHHSVDPPRGSHQSTRLQEVALCVLGRFGAPLLGSLNVARKHADAVPTVDKLADDVPAEQGCATGDKYEHRGFPMPTARSRIRSRSLHLGVWIVLGTGAGCSPYAAWPEAQTVFPWVYTPVEDLEPYEEVRFETETWVPIEDAEETALYALKSIYHRPGAPLEEQLHFGRARPTPLVEGHPTLSFAGDLLRMDDPAPAYATGVAHLLDGALRVGNLETPVSPNHPTERTALVRDYGIYAFNAPVSMLEGQPFDILQINNNHTLDLGQDGYLQTWKTARGLGFTPVSLITNRVDAELQGLQVTFLTYTWGVNNLDARTEYDLAIVPFGRLDEEIDLSRIRQDIRVAREEGASHVVLLLHWGYEYEYWPDPHFMVLGRKMVRYGADVIVGHGPHVAQPAELCAVNQPLAIPGTGTCSLRSDDNDDIRDAAILYSLGNFGSDLEGLPLEVGIVGTVSLDPEGGVSGLGWEAVARADSESGRVLRPLAELLEDEATSEEYVDEAARLDQLLGTSWKRSR